MSGTTKETFYNIMNLDSCFKQLGITGSPQYLRWVKDIINTKCTMFRYKNLPEGLTTEIIERALLFNNHLCWYNSTKLGGLILCKYRPGSTFDLYYKPVTVDLLTISGQPVAFGVPYEDIVLARDNTMDIIPFVTLNSYLEKIVELEKTLDILTRLVRFPTILTGDKKQTAMLQQVLKKNANCEGFIIGSKEFSQHLEQFDIKLPCSLAEVYDMLNQYKKLALGSIGIYSSDEKRERLITAEIQATNDFTDFVYAGMVEERKLFLRLINERFGSKIELEETYILNKKDDIKLTALETKAVEEEKAKAQNLIENKGGNDNGNN